MAEKRGPRGTVISPSERKFKPEAGVKPSGNMPVEQLAQVPNAVRFGFSHGVKHHKPSSGGRGAIPKVGGLGSSAKAGSQSFARPSGKPEMELYDKKPSKFNTVKAVDAPSLKRPVAAHKGASSGSITKPSPAAKKSRDELGAFYLQATKRMDVDSRPKKKK